MKCKLKDVCLQNRYPQLDAESIMVLSSESEEVKLLPSSKNYDLFTSYELAGDAVCNGEVITLGKARYANIKYWCGPFISSNNNIIESKNKDFLKGRYLYYFLSYTAKDYYVEATTYPKFDQKNFDNHPINIPNIETQIERLEILDSLTGLIEKEYEQLKKLDELTKSRFNAMFGSIENEYSFKTCSLGDEITTLSDFSANGSYAKLDSSVKMYDEPNYAWMVRTTDLENGHSTDIKYIDEKAYNLLSKSKLFGNELIMCKIGSAGKIYLMPKIEIPASLGRNAFLIRFNEKTINMTYLFAYLNTNDLQKDIQQRVKGAVTKTITKDEVRSIPLILPPKVLQDEYSSFVEQIDKLKFSSIEKQKKPTTHLFSDFHRLDFAILLCL